MPKLFSTYSNGWGHLIATCIIIAAITTALIFGKLDQTVYASMLTVVITFWFGTGIINTATRSQVAIEAASGGKTNGQSVV
jgi:hypothetical protein